ncbi:MerR family transcriptional regulator [Paenibacillus alkalitolerans]|uniref:MerR family transcriptional regulator n=1 Tax=Paenibacillus alkalitolerans TaxID=2799335 RepID=UPI0018F61372|nr:MerR family transcriptional regulator [Paenibacillus alkalitolerans]
MRITIKEVSLQTGVSVRSLRYYEKKKLLNPKRTENGYRRYSQADIERIQLIKFYLGVGLGTDEIAHFLGHAGSECEPVSEFQCVSEAISLYESRLIEVRQQMEVLKEQENKLLETLSSWENIRDRLNRDLPLERKEA